MKIMFYKYQLFFNKKLGIICYAGVKDDKLFFVASEEFSGEEKFVEVNSLIVFLFEEDDLYPRGQKIYYGECCDTSQMYSGLPDDKTDESVIRQHISRANKLLKKNKIFVD